MDVQREAEKLMAEISAREAARAPFDQLIRAVAALPDCDCTVTVMCADGVERRIERTKVPHG